MFARVGERPMEAAARGDTPRPAFLVIPYDNVKHNFRSWMQSALGVEDLSELHACSPFYPLMPNDRSIRARWTTLCQRKLSTFLPILDSFIKTDLAPHFLDVPTIRHEPIFRIHPPGWDSISPYHKDSAYGLPLGALNVWVPLTEVWDSNALWIESDEDRHDFRPVRLRHGQALIFDAVRLTHGSQKNETDYTRASFDFRCYGLLREHWMNNDKS
jgi:hypothetical protein